MYLGGKKLKNFLKTHTQYGEYIDVFTTTKTAENKIPGRKILVKNSIFSWTHTHTQFS